MYQIKLHHIFEFVFITAEVPEVYVLAFDKMAFEYCLRMGALGVKKVENHCSMWKTVSHKNIYTLNLVAWCN